MTLACPVAQYDSKNDFGGGISWVFIKFQAEIRSHISHLGFDDREDDEIFHQKGIRCL